MLALALMSAGWQAFFYGLACLMFVIAAVLSGISKAANWIAIGLALFTFVFFYNALAAA